MACIAGPVEKGTSRHCPHSGIDLSHLCPFSQQVVSLRKKILTTEGQLTQPLIQKWCWERNSTSEACMANIMLRYWWTSLCLMRCVMIMLPIETLSHSHQLSTFVSKVASDELWAMRITRFRQTFTPKARWRRTWESGSAKNGPFLFLLFRTAETLSPRLKQFQQALSRSKLIKALTKPTNDDGSEEHSITKHLEARKALKNKIHQYSFHRRWRAMLLVLQAHLLCHDLIDVANHVKCHLRKIIILTSQ